MPPTMRKRAPPQPHSVIVASTSSKRPSAAGKKPAKRPTESQKNGTVPDEAFNIDLLPAVVWVRVEGDERYGWWPGKVGVERSCVRCYSIWQRLNHGNPEPRSSATGTRSPFLSNVSAARSLGKIHPPPFFFSFRTSFRHFHPHTSPPPNSTISLAQPSTTSLLPFRHVRSAELRAAGADLPGFMDAMQMALDAETADDDGLPSLEKIISTPKKAKPEADKKGKKTKSAKKVRAEKEEEVRQDDMENPFAVSVANSSKGDRNDDYDDDFDFFAQNKDETLEIPGELVFAYYSEDKKYYPAKILEYFLTNGKYKVLYFDGAQRSLPRNRFYAMTERDFATCKVRSMLTKGFPAFVFITSRDRIPYPNVPTPPPGWRDDEPRGRP
ncbi:hypothetical protein BC936DRAFT_141322 [Jimgerdemannia flammicorona]|uniref:Tudor domain-containing protein n=1 Tax=Jimgerdemannia flammicorona TaxID=994334 RepID=A0A433A2E7_9FUNG|nr:hypothetical protein BC936DRAFT_141322 [Jimgerdemannia flammicorona]